MLPSPSEAVLSALVIGAELDDIPTVSEWIEGLAEQAGWPPALVFGLTLSVEEALANIITHGFPEKHHKPVIRLEYLRSDEGKVVVRIIDNGSAFDPTGVTAPDIAENIETARIGGHGVRLMRHFMEDIAYSRVGGENRLTLVAAAKKD